MRKPFVNEPASFLSDRAFRDILIARPHAASPVGDPLAASLTGTAGSDILTGTSDADIIDGLGGNDTLIGLAGDDTLNGGEGDDILSGGAGADILSGGAGSDTADYSGSAGRIAINLSTGLALGGDAHLDVMSGIENVIGTNSAVRDILTGDAAANILSGLAGDDELSGLGGDDILIGGTGADILTGGDGVDTADYSGSVDRIAINLTAGTAWGADAHLDVLTGVENLIGTNSTVQDLLTGDANANVIMGLDGDDQLNGMGGADSLFGGDGMDLLEGGDGDDVLTGGAGIDTLTGGAGRDTAVFSGNLSDYIITNQGGMTIVEGADGTDYLREVESLRFADAETDIDGGYPINGTAGVDTLQGTTGTDIINGLGGADLLYGLGNDDTLNGGDGNDLLVGGAGRDRLIGGDGNDTADYQASLSYVEVNLTTGTGRGGEFVGGGLHDDASGDTLSGIENIVGSNRGDDRLTGDAHANWLNGLAGNDQLWGMDGDDILIGGDGNDILNGGAGADSLIGGEGRNTADYSTSAGRIAVNLSTGTALGGDAHGDVLSSIHNLTGTNSAFTDWLTGDASANTLNGLAGDDELSGLGGDDFLRGGDGDDLIDGGDGIDTAGFTWRRSEYIVTQSGGLTTVTGPDGVDHLTGVEVLWFADMRTDAAGVQITSQIETAMFDPLKASTEGDGPLVQPGLEVDPSQPSDFAGLTGNLSGDQEACMPGSVNGGDFQFFGRADAWE